MVQISFAEKYRKKLNDQYSVYSYLNTLGQYWVFVSWKNFCCWYKINFSLHFLLFSSSQTNFQLGMQRTANNCFIERIKKALEAQLKECQHFNLLPGNTNLSATSKGMYLNAKKFYSKTYYEAHKALIVRCKKLRNVLPYAQKILCWWNWMSIIIKLLTN